MKKILLPMMAGCMFFASDCFAMRALPDAADLPKTLVAMRALLREVYMNGEQVAQSLAQAQAQLGLVVTLSAVKGRLLGDGDIRTDLRGQLMMLSSSLSINSEFNKVSTNANPTPMHDVENAADRINLFTALINFMDSCDRGANGVLDADNANAADIQNPTKDKILSLYRVFSEQIGNSDKEAASSFNIAAKTVSAGATTDRSIHKLVSGMTLGNLRNADCLAAINAVYGAPVVADEQDCLWMGFLALVEMAERGTLNEGSLKDGGNQAGPLGYTPEIVERIKEILPALQ